MVQRPLIARCLADALAWAFALTCATLARYDFAIERVWFLGIALAFGVVVAAQWFIGSLCGLYTGRSRLGSIDEIPPLAECAVGVTAVLAIVDSLVPRRLVPIGACLGAGLMALVVMGASRAVWRLTIEKVRRPRGEPILIFGAGDAGARIVAALLRDPTSPYLPMGFLDDDPSKRKLRIVGVPVLGSRRELPQAALKTAARILLIALPSADSRLIRELTALADRAGLTVKVLPSLVEMLGDETVRSADIRDLTPADLLGRRQVETDVPSIAGYLSGRRVLVTGAGGSIGSELCRQIARYNPSELFMLDRDESALHAVQLTLEGRALLDSPNILLADIRDATAIRDIFNRVSPDVVFHAAALKHLPLLERFPAEAVKTNILGTLNVLEAARDAGVSRFVNISTDKAADPSSVLGYTKRVGERLTSFYAHEDVDSPYLSVRFGNVLGSRGSVLLSLQAQIEQGGPVTVTDPEVTRYFMTVEEAVQLVIQAGAIGRGGQALILDMGQPVKIADVARMLIARSGREIDLVFTGLRQGEKRHEDLFGERELGTRGAHPLISHVEVPLMPPWTARTLDSTATGRSAISAMSSLCDVSVDALNVIDLTSAAHGVR